MAPNSPACAFSHAWMAGSRSTAPSNRSNSDLIIAPFSAFEDTVDWSGGLGFFQSFGQCGHDFKDVGDDAVVRDFENWRVGVLVDGDDGARAFHADNMLDRAADAEREIKFGRDSLPGTADLALHRQPAFVADGARSRDFSAESFRERLGLRNIFRRLDAAADRHDERRLR